MVYKDISREKVKEFLDRIKTKVDTLLKTMKANLDNIK